MGMPITIDIVDGEAAASALNDTFDYFRQIDARYSTYKPESEISRINRGLPESAWSEEMKHVLALCEQTKAETGGYFDIVHDGKRDPSGLVKGWAIQQAAERLQARGLPNFSLEAGGDFCVCGTNRQGQLWRIGIRNPFRREEIVKVVTVSDAGIATSGTAVRGQHIYDPHEPDKQLTDIVSLTVIGPDIYEADRFATAAFAMGTQGIRFIESLHGFEGYMIDAAGSATLTSDFERYVADA